MRVEQEQKVTEDARRFAEQDAAAQRYAAQVLQVTLFLSSSFLVAHVFSRYLLQKQTNQRISLYKTMVVLFRLYQSS